jgi:hypothetical protein
MLRRVTLALLTTMAGAAVIPPLVRRRMRG